MVKHCLVALALCLISLPAFGEPPALPAPPTPPKRITWDTTGKDLAVTAAVQEVQCPAATAFGAKPVYGIGPYATAWSPVCAAAVHAGLITLERGGVVGVKADKPTWAFAGSTAHGVTSKSFEYTGQQQYAQMALLPARTSVLAVTYNGNLTDVEILRDGQVLGRVSPNRPLMLRGPDGLTVVLTARHGGHEAAQKCTYGADRCLF